MLTRKENVYLIKRNIAQLVHDNGHSFAGLTTSLPDTTSVVKGVVPKNMLTSQVDIIIALYRAWRYVVDHRGPLTLAVIQEINCRASPDNLNPGHFRYKPAVITGVKYRPPMPSVKVVKSMIRSVISKHLDDADKAIEIMLKLDRLQLFWDGNERTAMLTANYYLLQHCSGVLNISTDLIPKWIKLLSSYYETGKMNCLTKWLKQNCLTTSLGSY